VIRPVHGSGRAAQPPQTSAAKGAGDATASAVTGSEQQDLHAVRRNCKPVKEGHWHASAAPDAAHGTHGAIAVATLPIAEPCGRQELPIVEVVLKAVYGIGEK